LVTKRGSKHLSGEDYLWPTFSPTKEERGDDGETGGEGSRKRVRISEEHSRRWAYDTGPEARLSGDGRFTQSPIELQSPRGSMGPRRKS
jgi:hypothetical protein